MIMSIIVNDKTVILRSLAKNNILNQILTSEVQYRIASSR